MQSKFKLNETELQEGRSTVKINYNIPLDTNTVNHLNFIKTNETKSKIKLNKHKNKSISYKSLIKPKEIVHNFNHHTMRCATATDIHVNEELVESLVDTGAYTSFMSENYFIKRKFNKEKIINKKQWITANGTPIEVAGQTTVDLKIGDERLKGTFIIAKSLAQNIIIGVDILKRNNCIVNYSNNTLRCKNSEIKLKTFQPFKTSIVRANCSIEIAPFETSLMWIPHKPTQNQLFIQSVGRSRVLEMLTNVSNDGEHKNSLPVIITNNSPCIKRINKGDAIASISSPEVVCEINTFEKFNEFIKKETLEVKQNEISYNEPWKPSQQIKFTNKSLTVEQKQKLRDLIDEYWMVSSRGDEDIGQLNEEYGTHDYKGDRYHSNQTTSV